METEGKFMGAARGLFVPFLLLAVAVLAFLAFQALQLHRVHGSLAAKKAGQEERIEQAQGLRKQFDAVATDTARLAEGGNANAKRIIDELRKRGIRVNPDAVATTEGAAGDAADPNR